MNLRIILLVTLCTLIAACAIPVYDDEIDWRYPKLSRDGCPDLSGRYFDDGKPRQEMIQCPASWLCNRVEGLFPLMISKFNKLPGYRFEKHAYLSKPNSKNAAPLYMTMIMHSSSEIELRLNGAEGMPYSSLSVPIWHERVGCHDGGIIVRTVGNSIGSEGGSGSVQYSETEIRKTSDGGLILTEWRAWRYRSKLTGKAYGEPRDVARRSWRFEPVR